MLWGPVVCTTRATLPSVTGRPSGARKRAEAKSSDEATNSWEVTTISRIAGDADTGPWVLVYQIAEFSGGTFVDETDPIPLLEGLTELQFSLEYEVGPRLRRATIDMVIRPDDNDDNTVSVRMDAPHIRMVASATPRMYD